MSRERVLAGVAAIAVLAAAVSVISAAHAATPPVWEHKVVYLNHDEFKETEVYKQLEKELKNAFLATLRMQEIALNNLGADGWQLVAIEQKTPAQPTFYLKREVTPGR